MCVCVCVARLRVGKPTTTTTNIPRKKKKPKTVGDPQPVPPTPRKDTSARSTAATTTLHSRATAVNRHGAEATARIETTLAARQRGQNDSSSDIFNYFHNADRNRKRTSDATYILIFYYSFRHRDIHEIESRRTITLLQCTVVVVVVVSL